MQEVTGGKASNLDGLIALDGDFQFTNLVGVAGLGNALFNQGAHFAELFDRLSLGSELAHIAIVERIAWKVFGLDEAVRVSSFKLSFLCIADTRIKRLLKAGDRLHCWRRGCGRDDFFHLLPGHTKA